MHEHDAHADHGQIYTWSLHVVWQLTSAWYFKLVMHMATLITKLPKKATAWENTEE